MSDPRQLADDGPWETFDFDDAQTLVRGPLYGEGRRALVAICTGEKRHANARLAASAPELRDVLAYWLNVVENSTSREVRDAFAAWTGKARDVLRRAKGES